MKLDDFQVLPRKEGLKVGRISRRGCFFFLILSGLCATGWVHASPQRNSKTSVLATVNGSPITNVDIADYTRLLLFNAKLQNTYANRRALQENQKVLRFIINERLQREAFGRVNLTLSKKELVAGFKSFLKSQRLKKKALRGRFAKYGITNTFFMRTLETQLLWQKFVSLSARGEIQVSNYDVRVEKKLLEKSREDKLRHLYVIFIPAYNKTTGELSKEVGSVFKKLDAGKSFPALSKSFPHPAGRKSNNFGWIYPRASLPPQLAAIVSKLGPKETSAPVRTPEGVYIFHVSGIKKGPQTAPPTEEQVRTYLIERKLQSLSHKLTDELWQSAYIHLLSSKNA